MRMRYYDDGSNNETQICNKMIDFIKIEFIDRIEYSCFVIEFTKFIKILISLERGVGGPKTLLVFLYS